VSTARNVRVLLAVTGSIASYKAAEVARGLVKLGVDVRALMSPGARKFLGETTLLGLTGNPVATRLFDGAPGERHVDLWRGADAMLVAPATADALARFAQGRASDIVSATVACRRGPLFVAPAMHPSMWSNPAVERNVERLREDGVHFLGPVVGEVASRETGLGRMLEPEAIVEAVLRDLGRAADFAGRKVIVSAGPTFEDLDPVRFLGNRSSGKMGYAIARAALARGANVTLVSGPVSLASPDRAMVIRVRSALEMQNALVEASRDADLVVMAAAVADFRPELEATAKIAKRAMPEAVRLVQNPDIVRGLAEARRDQRPILVAFALETGDDDSIVERARQKLADKGVDFVVANSAADGFESDDNRAAIIDGVSTPLFERSSKLLLAHRILDRARSRFERETKPNP
jgi:phosphopantothenoylcysteine decarboxylase / phosphopantothenate---cysteine ligase